MSETMETTTTETTTPEGMTALEAAQARAAELWARIDPKIEAWRAEREAASRTAPVIDPASIEIHGHLTRVGQARVTFEREKAKLFNAQGQPIDSETEHATRLQALQSTLDGVIAEAQTAADGIIAAQQALLQHLEHGDLFDTLEPADKSAAAAGKAFVQGDAASLPVADLATRCRIALASGDKATAYLLARYVGQRVTMADKAGAEGRQPEMHGDERRLLGDLVRELRAKVQGSEGAKKAEAARALQAKALELRGRTRAAYNQAHDRPVAIEAYLRGTGRYSI